MVYQTTIHGKAGTVRQESIKGPQLNKYGIKLLLGNVLMPCVQCTIFWGVAGTIDIPGGWLFLLLSEMAVLGGLVPVAIKNPELINYRGAWKKMKDTKLWDIIIAMMFSIVSIHIVALVSGLDFRLNHGARLGTGFMIAGAAFFILSEAIFYWAMMVNRHFESTVRIQKDRNHQVVSGGPYKIVRHPGYVGAILWTLATPLILGSVWGIVPAVVAILMLILRTSLEDKTLHRELEGYGQYARQTRYRLLAKVW